MDKISQNEEKCVNSKQYSKNWPKQSKISCNQCKGTALKKNTIASGDKCELITH